MKKITLLLAILFFKTFASNAQCYSSIEAGTDFNIAIKTDGTLWGWGKNDNGQLGDGTFVNKNTPTKIGTENDWQTISVGDNHTLAVKTNGTLWGWGNNAFSKIGFVSSGQVTSPTQVGIATNWAIISAGSNHSMAIKFDGTLWGWGRNFEGQLGNGGSPTVISSPTQIGTATNWSEVATGLNHSIATRSGNTLWGWGQAGEVGDGSNIQRNLPVQIGTGTNWAQPFANTSSMATKTDGTLWAWGNNGNGQLGIGSTANQLNPVQVGTATNWRNVSMGFGHTLAVNASNTLYGWGRNANGQLGDGTTVNKLSPIIISQNILKMAAGSEQNIATLTNTLVYTWGSNQYGQIGTGTTSTTGQPVAPTSINCPTSLANSEFEIDNYSVYPNPVNDIMTINNKNLFSENTTITIFDITGKLIQSKFLNDVDNKSSIEIEIQSNIEKGLYFLQIKQDNIIQTIKFIKN